jgi:hypothetical protein
MKKLDKQIHERKKDWLERHQKELPSNFHIINRQEDVIQERQEEDGLMFQDGMRQQTRQNTPGCI